MSILQTSKAGLDSALGLIAKRLRSECDDAAHRPLPERWMELIQRLNELEKRASASSKPSPKGVSAPTRR